MLFLLRNRIKESGTGVSSASCRFHESRFYQVYSMIAFDVWFLNFLQPLAIQSISLMKNLEKHVEHWNVPKMALLKQILRPSRGLSGKKSSSEK
ncbi:UNVERIFIED_CONTAM: hypothetical protein Sindi_2270400 [Sesamum indicum]